MPRRNDLHRILIVGSGPIVIGQACEFDASGTQAAKALRADGYEVVLVNSTPATIMTDPDLADKTYVEPLTAPYLEEIIRRERPDALLSTVGGQTGLNLAVELAEAGILDKYGVELIGAKIDAIKKAEDRLLFKDAMRKIGLETPQSQLVNTVKGGLEFADRKSTRLNSSHLGNSYAVFCLKKKTKEQNRVTPTKTRAHYTTRTPATSVR